MKFCVIIPDRGDRTELTEHCKAQLKRMTLQPSGVFHIDYPPVDNSYDLVARIRRGVNEARTAGFDLCFVMENDDFYGADYFERFQPFFPDFHFFGQEFSDYYNLRNLTHNRFDHQYRASLFTTGFKISALNNFEWPASDKPFLDIELWRYARHKRRKFIDTGAIGMKHGLGLCGGKGHRMNLRNSDRSMNWLRSKVDAESFEFYQSLSKKLTLQPV